MRSWFLLSLAACQADPRASDEETSPGGDPAAEEADADADADTDADSDADLDADADADSDADADADADADTDADADEEPGDTAEPEPECDAETPVTLFLSPDDSNSMSSPVQARIALLSGWTDLDEVPLRTWEFMNYYRFDYAPPADEDLGVYLEMVPDEEAGDGSYYLQIGVRSPDLAPADRRPMNLTFVLDTSCSMSGEPLDRLKDVGWEIAGQLKAGDVVSMVTWSTGQNVILSGHAVSGPGDADLLNAFLELQTDGGTNLSAGLTAGYELADLHRSDDRINRVILISDGGANAGITDEELIGQHAEDELGEGLYLVGVGVGSDASYNDDLMDAVTDAGKGASIFINSENEAERIFGEDGFESALDLWARDVQVQLDLPPGFEIARFSGEEYSADPAEIEPQHLAPNDAMVFFQSIRTCEPGAVTADTPIAVTVRYRDALTFEERSVRLAATFGELLAEDPALLAKGRAIFYYAEGLKLWTEASGFSEKVDIWDRMMGYLDEARALNPGDPDLEEIYAALEAL